MDNWIIASTIAAAISTIVAAIALIRQRRVNQAQLMQPLFDRLSYLEEKLYFEVDLGNSEEADKWAHLFFNAVEYLAFLVNHNYLNSKLVTGYYQGSIKSWHDKIYTRFFPEKEVNLERFPEFKKLYLKISTPKKFALRK